MVQPATAAVRLLSGEREPVRVATTANIDLAGLQTVDGIALAVNDRVLVKNQTDARENGIYTSSTGRWSRASDASFPRAISAGITVQVVYGTTHGGQAWRFDTFMPNIGVDDILLNFYLSADLVADAEAAVQNVIALATEQADRAEDAADLALSAVSGVIAPKATLSLAIADDPAVDPEYYDIAYFDTAYQTGSGAKWRKVVSNPGLVSGAAFQNANGAWYVNDSEWLKPEQFGRIGVDAATDTAAWVRLVAAANHRGGKLKVRVSNDLNLNGTGTATDSQTFINFTSIWVRGDDVEVYQRNSLSKTFKFIAADAKAKVTGIEFVGYAEQQIDAAITPNEIDFDASSGNAVAGIYAEDLYELDIKRISSRNHAGRDIDCRGVLHLKGRDLDLVGLGPTYNDPVGDGHQGNGEDAAIYHIPKIDNVPGVYYDPATTNAWRQTIDVCNSRIKWHSFCIRTILNKAIVLHGNIFGETPGQHHVYDTDSDGHDIIGNVFEDCRQIGYKMQFENIAGLNLGPTWQAATAYAVGDVVRAFGIAWVAHTAHTSGGSFSSTNWNQHPRYLRRGGVWQGNNFRGCGQGVGIIESSNVSTRNIWSEGYIVSGNTFEDCSESIYMDRCWKATVTNNNVRGGEYGFYGRNFSGTMSNNDFHDVGKNCVLIIGLSKASAMEGNKFFNYGSTGTSSDTSAAVLIIPPNIDEPPVNSNAPRMLFKDNGFFHYINGEAADTADAPNAYLVFCTDTAAVWEIEGTYGTPTTRQFRIDGTVAYQFRNHFPSYANSAQNEKAFTAEYTNDFNLEAASTVAQVRDVLGTLLVATLKPQRVVK